MEIKKAREKVNETKNLSFEKNKTDKPLARLIKIKIERAQIHKI